MEPIGNDLEYGCLRSLSPDDVPGMLEWMHDGNIAAVFSADFMKFTEKDAERFVKGSWTDAESLHFAIAEADGTYLGTVSLKHIDSDNLSAEYAISTRKAAQGTGAAMRATEDVLAYAFEELGLERVYLNVKSTNLRAVRFYEKVPFAKEGAFRKAIRDADGQLVDLLWFSMLREDFIKKG